MSKRKSSDDDDEPPKSQKLDGATTSGDSGNLLLTRMLDNPSLFMQEYEIEIMDMKSFVAEKPSVRIIDYTGKTLDEILAILVKKAYPVVTSAFLHKLFCVFYTPLGGKGLMNLERIVVDKPEKFYLHYMSLLYAIANMDALPHKCKKNIKKVDTEHNITRFNYQVALNTSGSNIHMYFLAPTRKEQLNFN